MTAAADTLGQSKKGRAVSKAASALGVGFIWTGIVYVLAQIVGLGKGSSFLVGVTFGLTVLRFFLRQKEQADAN